MTAAALVARCCLALALARRRRPRAPTIRRSVGAPSRPSTSTSTSIRCPTAAARSRSRSGWRWSPSRRTAADAVSRPGPQAAKTHVVVTDDTDDYNGFAGVHALSGRSGSTPPRPTIAPSSTTTTTGSRGLFMHEYTHILHIGTIGGPCAPVVNAILGLGARHRLSRPTSCSRASSSRGWRCSRSRRAPRGGRLRNSIWDMYLRAQTLEGKFQRIDQFTHVPIQFPYGNSAYLYGSALMRFVAEQYGAGRALRRCRSDYGIGSGVRLRRRAINRSIRRVTGKTWVQLYDEFKRGADAQVHARSATPSPARGITPTRVLDCRPTRPRRRGRCSRPTGNELIVLRRRRLLAARRCRAPIDAPTAAERHQDELHRPSCYRRGRPDR